jgi:hypothetical protein
MQASASIDATSIRRVIFAKAQPNTQTEYKFDTPGA